MISFESESDLIMYEGIPWELNESHFVEFFPNRFFKVTLISTESPDFEKHLNELDDGNIISLDLEWENELCLFQFCSSNGVLIIRHPNGKGNQHLHEFFLSHYFYAKGIRNDATCLMRKSKELNVLNQLTKMIIRTVK